MPINAGDDAAEDDEHDVAESPQPFDETRSVLAQVVKTPGMPVAVVENVGELQDASKAP